MCPHGPHTFKRLYTDTHIHTHTQTHTYTQSSEDTLEDKDLVSVFCTLFW